MKSILIVLLSLLSFFSLAQNKFSSQNFELPQADRNIERRQKLSTKQIEDLDSGLLDRGQTKGFRGLLEKSPVEIDLKDQLNERKGIRVVGNGGDFDALFFRQIGLELAANFEKSYPRELKPINLEKFKSVLDAKVIFIDEAIEVEKVPKVAANIPAEKVILVDRFRWHLNPNWREKVVLVFHEYLGLMDEDKSNEISTGIYALPSLSTSIIALAYERLGIHSAHLDIESQYEDCYASLVRLYIQAFATQFGLKERIGKVGPYSKEKFPDSIEKNFELFVDANSVKFVRDHYIRSSQRISAGVALMNYEKIASLDQFFGRKEGVLIHNPDYIAGPHLRLRGVSSLFKDLNLPGFNWTHKLMKKAIEGMQITPQCQKMMKTM